MYINKEKLTVDFKGITLSMEDLNNIGRTYNIMSTYEYLKENYTNSDEELWQIAEAAGDEISDFDTSDVELEYIDNACKHLEIKLISKAKLHKRANYVRAMETIVRSLNDEEFLDSWLMVGVADGDINGNETDEDLECYCEDNIFASLMSTFCRIMRRANADEDIDEEERNKGNGILYFDGITSKWEE